MQLEWAGIRLYTKDIEIDIFKHSGSSLATIELFHGDIYPFKQRVRRHLEYEVGEIYIIIRIGLCKLESDIYSIF